MEFAVVCPLLFALFFGIVEFGRAMMVLGVVTNAARAGVRAGAVSSGTYTSIDTAWRNAMTSATIADTNCSAVITYTSGGATVTATDNSSFSPTAGSTISVKISVPYSKVSWLPNGGFFLSGVTMSETAVMRREG